MTDAATGTTTEALVEQLDFHWQGQLRPRLDGLTDAEYFDEPVDGCWSVRPRGASTAPVQGGSGGMVVEFAFPEPDPAPFTTIAWRLAHLIVGVFAVRNAAHFGAPPTDYFAFDYATGADQALAQLDAEVATWRAGVIALDDAALWAPVGEAEPGPYAERPMIDLVLHIHREVIHHGAEIALLRDLYAHRRR